MILWRGERETRLIMIMITKTMMFNLWMVCMAFTTNNRSKTMMRISRVINDSFCSIRFIQPILALNFITIPSFPSLFMISGMCVFYAIAKFVVNWILFFNHIWIYHWFICGKNQQTAVVFLHGSRGAPGVHCNAYDMDWHNDHHVGSLDCTVHKHLSAHNIELLIELHQSNPSKPKKENYFCTGFIHKNATCFELLSPELGCFSFEKKNYSFSIWYLNNLSCHICLFIFFVFALSVIEFFQRFPLRSDANVRLILQPQ